MIVGPCRVVTGGARPHVIEDCAVRVVGAHIAQVGPAGCLALAHPEETVWPGRGRVLMPGLVNAHAHLARHLARGLDLHGEAAWERYDRALSPEDVHWSSMAALVEGVRHGVTTVCDFHRSGACLDLSLSEVVSAAARVGARVATCYGAAEHDSELERRAALEESLGFARALARQRTGRARALLGVRASTQPGLDRLLHEALEVAGDALAIHVELALDATPAERWPGGRAWPEARVPALWAHVERAPRALRGIVRDRGDAFAATDTWPLGALAREDDLAWGSDAGLNAPPLPESGPTWTPEPRLAAAQYRHLMATGPRWAERHFGDALGRLEAGAPADLQLVDYQPATELSSRTLLAHLGAGLLRAPTSGVMVAGEVIMDHGALVSVDEAEVAARARECARRVWARLD